MTIDQIFDALGNDRPQILIELEDHVIRAIIGISEGKSREDAMGFLYSQIQSLQKDLANDDNALNWFNLTKATSSIPPTPPPSKIPFTPLPKMPVVVKDLFHGWWFHIDIYIVI